MTSHSCPVGGDVTSSRHWPRHSGFRRSSQGEQAPSHAPQASELRKLPPASKAPATFPSSCPPTRQLSCFPSLPPTTSQAQPPSSSCSDEGRGQRPRLVSPRPGVWLHCQVHHLLPVPATFSGLCHDGPTLGSRPCSDVTSWQRPLTQRCPA